MMSSHGREINNPAGKMSLRTRAEDPRPEAKAAAVVAGFANQSENVDTKGTARPFSTEKQGGIAESSSGEKRKMPAKQSEVSLEPVVRRKKRSSRTFVAATAAGQIGHGHSKDNETTETSEEAAGGTTLEDPVDVEEEYKKNWGGVEEETEEKSSETTKAVTHEEKWEIFLTDVDEKERKMFEGYMQAKEARLVQRTKFKKTLQACIDSLTACGKVFIEETSRKACAKRKIKMKASQDDITDTLVSNDDRRQNFMDKMDEADRLWKDQYENLMGKLIGGSQFVLSKKPDDDASAEDATNEQSVREKDDTGVSNSDAGKDSSQLDGPAEEEAPQVDEEPDWNKICQFAPSHESVGVFLDAKDRFSFATANVEETQIGVEQSMMQEILELIEMIEAFADKIESRIFDLEYDIEAHAMANHDIRADQEERLQSAAERAKSAFSTLMQKLVHSMH